MIATTEQAIFDEVKAATGLPDRAVREIVAIELGQSPGDVIADGNEDQSLPPQPGILDS